MNLNEFEEINAAAMICFRGQRGRRCGLSERLRRRREMTRKKIIEGAEIRR